MFIHYELKERWDNLKELSRIQWEALDKANKENNIDSQVKICALLCKINDQLLQMVMILPQIAISTKSFTLSFSSPSKLDWKDDPTFIGMLGHNLDENYNPRPDPDFARDQP